MPIVEFYGCREVPCTAGLAVSAAPLPFTCRHWRCAVQVSGVPLKYFKVPDSIDKRRGNYSITCTQSGASSTHEYPVLCRPQCFSQTRVVCRVRPTASLILGFVAGSLTISHPRPSLPTGTMANRLLRKSMPWSSWYDPAVSSRTTLMIHRASLRSHVHACVY